MLNPVEVPLVLYSQIAPLALTAGVWESVADELVVNHTLFAVSIARLRGVEDVAEKRNGVFVKVYGGVFATAELTTRTSRVVGVDRRGVPVGLSSAKPGRPPFWLRTQTLPVLSTAMFWGFRSVGVPVVMSLYWMPTVQSVGCVPTPAYGDVPVCNAYRAARLVVGCRLMWTAAPKVSVADVAVNSAVHAELPEPVVLTHAARILAMVFSFVASGVVVIHKAELLVQPFGKLADVTATPVLMLTRLFTVANALARPVVFVGDVPIIGDAMNCPRAMAVAAVVTSLTVMKVLEFKLPHCPSGAASMVAVLAPLPVESPPDARR